MTRQTLIALVKKSAAGAVLAAALFAAAPAQAQVVVEFPAPEVVATTPPVYYQGRAHYWYGNRWWYRDGPRWGYYHDEPVYLHDWRWHHGYDHRYYEGRYGPRGGWRERRWRGW